MVTNRYMHTEKARVAMQEYWNKQPCNSKQGAPFAEGTSEYFEKIEQERYNSQGFIHQFVQFSRWHGKNVLEVGCGLGTDGLQFIRSGAYYEGIDMSAKSVELSEKRFHLYGFRSSISNPNFRCTVMDAEKMSFENSMFDLVYSWGVIHHSPNPEKVISEIYRVLKPGGMFKIMLYRRFSAMGLAVWIQYIRQQGYFANPFVSLREAFANGLESPGTKAYKVSEIKKLLEKFRDLKFISVFTPEFDGLKNTPFLPLLKFYPNCLSSWIAIEGIKRKEDK